MNLYWGNTQQVVGSTPPTGATVYTGCTTEFDLIVPEGVATMEYLCIAGGGAGGYVSASLYTSRGGGGGAGGYLAGTVSSPTAGIYKCKVGCGGSGDNGIVGNSGGNSYISGTSLNITAVGGGGGGNAVSSSSRAGAAGGSGGGGGKTGSNSNVAAGGAGTSGQGYAGAASYWNYDDAAGVSGGGGGSAAAGGAGGGYNSRNGGLGTSNSITGTAVTYCTGGIGGGNSAGTYYGDGGDGASKYDGTKAGYDGKQGVIIIKFTYS